MLTAPILAARGPPRPSVGHVPRVDHKLGAWQSAEEPAWNVMRGTAGHLVSLTHQSRLERGGASEQFLGRIERGEAIPVGD